MHKAHAKHGVKSPSHNWIRKHQYQIEICLLEGCTSAEHLNEREIYWIAHYRAIGNKMMNVLEGGGTSFTGKKRPAHSAQMSGANNPMYGKNRREAMIYARSFQGSPSEETRERMRQSQIGRKHTMETRAKISSANKEFANRPEEKVRRSKNMTGAGNPQAKLNEDDIREIRRLRETGQSYYSIAKDFHMAPESISNICRRITWKHIE